jgi:ketosteroid isomerase-like protein
MKINLAVFLVIFCLCSCQKQANSNEEAIPAMTLSGLTQQWNEALSKHDVEALSELYADTIYLYGRSKLKSQALEEKKAYFENVPDYQQRIENLVLIQNNETNSEISFLKTHGKPEKEKTVKSYLEFTKYNGEWKISTEGDVLTDENLKQEIVLFGGKATLVGELFTVDHEVWTHGKKDGIYLAKIIRLNKPISIAYPTEEGGDVIDHISPDEKEIQITVQGGRENDRIFKKMIGKQIKVTGIVAYPMTYYTSRHSARGMNIYPKSMKDIKVLD